VLAGRRRKNVQGGLESAHVLLVERSERHVGVVCVLATVGARRQVRGCEAWGGLDEAGQRPSNQQIQEG
jgi:hypothetical protein